MQGYDVFHNGLCVTVFSAPNYCGDTRNLGAVIRFDKPDSMLATVAQFADVARRDAFLAQQKRNREEEQHPQEQ